MFEVIVATKDKRHHLFCSHPAPRLAALKEFRVDPPLASLMDKNPRKFFYILNLLEGIPTPDFPVDVCKKHRHLAVDFGKNILNASF